MIKKKEMAREEAVFESEDLGELAGKVRSFLDIRDRKYGFPPKDFKKCFVGSEAVKALIKENIAGDEEDAVRIGNMMMNAGLIHHVQYAHAFKNEYLFYRFSTDEDHGKPVEKADGTAVSWSDFLSPVGAAGEKTLLLQPDIPERDPELAEFAQDDLETIGIQPLDEHNSKLLDYTHPKEWIDPEPKSKYNLVIIGAGAGGLVAAAGAAGVGARTALIESHLLGGDCLNVGCIPSKALLRCAKAVASIRNAEEFGIRISGDITVDFGAIMERMRRLRASLAQHDSAERFARQIGVDVFIGKGKFKGRNAVEVNGQTLEFSKAVIATGGTAAIPPIPGLRDVPFLTNASVFNLTELPRRLGVIGAGPIGLELAQAFQRFGSRVTVVSRGGDLLPREDPEAAALVGESLRRDGIRILYNARSKMVESKNGKSPITLTLETDSGEKKLECDALLVATGRKPAVRGLDLEKAGVAYDERMGVKVDAGLETTNASIYAVGDVASRYQFTHMADFMARLMLRNALFLGREKVTNLLIPWATYTDPEVAHVGLYEKDLRDRKVEFQTFKREFSEVDRAIVDGDTDGFVKIHVKKGTDQILGATIAGGHAGDMISEITVAMQNEMGLGKLANVIHPYPTTAEAVRQCGDEYNRTRLTPTVKKIFYNLMALQR